MLEFARERFAHPRVTYVQADAVEYTPDEPVDVAVLSNVLEHIEPRVELLRALRERAGARPAAHPRARRWSGTGPCRFAERSGCRTSPIRSTRSSTTRSSCAPSSTEAGWEMGEPQLNWGEIWVEASAR